MDLQGAFLCHFSMSSELRKIGCGYLLFYKDHCCFTVIAFVFIFSKGARMAKNGLVTGPKKGGRQFVTYLFLFLFFFFCFAYL